MRHPNPLGHENWFLARLDARRARQQGIRPTYQPESVLLGIAIAATSRSPSGNPVRRELAHDEILKRALASGMAAAHGATQPWRIRRRKPR